jgi:hypothetical protein
MKNEMDVYLIGKGFNLKFDNENNLLLDYKSRMKFFFEKNLKIKDICLNVGCGLFFLG